MSMSLIVPDVPDSSMVGIHACQVGSARTLTAGRSRQYRETDGGRVEFRHGVARPGARVKPNVINRAHPADTIA
jgi:hypothetical protein